MQYALPSGSPRSFISSLSSRHRRPGHARAVAGPWICGPLVFLLAGIASAPGATLYVSPGSPSPGAPYADLNTAAHDIQTAINAASPGDTIRVNDGTYATGSTVIHAPLPNRVAINKAVTVQSINGPGVTTIQGAGPNGASAVRGVYVGAGAVLTGFTVTGGATADTGDVATLQSGGGIWCDSAGVVNNCVITGNKAVAGGNGVYRGTLNDWGHGRRRGVGGRA
jgi:hypothetical protein